MSFVGNLLWFVFGGGFLIGTIWLLAGLICCCTIVGLPLGIACLRICVFAYFPFGRVLVPVEWTGEERVMGTALMNLFWCVFLGVWMSIACVLLGVFYCCTIVGIPYGLAYFKLCTACFAPLGKRIVPTALGKELQARNAVAKADKMLNK